ncbi:MAG: transcriptional regulator [Sphingobium sp.]|nr:MAG: transcriptional regulator [Sphingobium sp.]
MAEADQTDLTTLTVQLLSAYVSNNTVASEDLAGLIQSTRKALEQVGTVEPTEAAPEHVPAVTTRRSLSSKDFILSLIDGKPYKTLKRHLEKHGLTPDSYRERYSLPKSYPMVAPSYALQRREIAQRLGLGRKPAVAKETPAQADAAPKAKLVRKAANKTKTPKVTVAAPAPAEKPVKKPKPAAAPKVTKSAVADAAKVKPKRAPRKRVEKPAAPENAAG